jgi:carboxynorspermidine decarboxylase
MGAYTLVRANRFNGVALPSLYSLHGDGTIHLESRDDYREFSRTWERRPECV